ncbi:MAG: hypothetical protein WD069_13425, partial [Planctomycetales bacterium]
MEERTRRQPRRRLGFALFAAVAAIVPTFAAVLWPASDAGRNAGDAAQQSVVRLPLASVPAQGGTQPEAALGNANASAAQGPAANDASLRRRLLGKWTQYNYGQRLLTVLEDGTATIVAEPDGVWKFLFGERIRIDIEWELENGRVKFETVGGEPRDKADLVAQHWGRTRDTAIVA